DITYRPGWSAPARYRPFASVTSSRVAFVSALRTVTATPGRTPPVASVTCPSMLAVAAVCAAKGSAHNVSAASVATTHVSRRFLTSFTGFLAKMKGPRRLLTAGLSSEFLVLTSQFYFSVLLERVAEADHHHVHVRHAGRRLIHAGQEVAARHVQ